MNIRTLAQPEIIHLTDPGKHLYLIENPEGVFKFSLDAPGVEVLVVCLKKFSGETEKSLEIIQHHTAPHTRSEVLIKTLLEDTARFHYKGMIHIDTIASGSTASQETRGLLLSPEARFEAIPSLEILPADVICHHKASASPINSESVFTLQSRGLSKKEAETLLEEAFLESGKEKLIEWGVSDQCIEQTYA